MSKVRTSPSSSGPPRGNVEKLASLATELVGLKVDVIVTPTEPAARAVKEATSTIPIVMAGINYDPIALGYVATLARPGGNVTGIFFRHIELTAKRLELFKEMVPTVKRVAIFSDPLTIDQLRAVEAANTRIQFRLQPLELRHSPYDFRSAFSIAMRSHAEAIFVLESSPIFRQRMQITQLALKNRLPTSFAFREYVEAGGLMAYGASFVEMAGLAAVYVDKILKGAKPADLPGYASRCARAWSRSSTARGSTRRRPRPCPVGRRAPGAGFRHSSGDPSRQGIENVSERRWHGDCPSTQPHPTGERDRNT
jgi:putative tryptophan/tyrosine transport system substrate-binding protein